jgi:hypothetical protein
VKISRRRRRTGSSRQFLARWRGGLDLVIGRDASRRRRSIARLRAVFRIHPAGSAARRPPANTSRGEGVGHGLLGDVDVAEDPNEHGDRAAVLGAEDALDL